MGKIQIPLVVAFLLLWGCGGDEGPTGSSVPLRGVRRGPKLLDPRDARIYPTVWIGERLWMAADLDHDTLDDSLSWCPGGTASGCAAHGRLYSWRIAVGEGAGVESLCDVYPDSTRGVCPSGWHLPSKPEWQDLLGRIGGADRAGTILKSVAGWGAAMDGASGGGTDSVGFSALPGGYRFTGDQGYGYYGHTPGDSAFFGLGDVAAFWTRTNTQLGSCWSAWSVHLSAERASAEFRLVPRGSGFSVRCVRN